MSKSAAATEAIAAAGREITPEDIKAVYLTVRENKSADADKQKYAALLADIAALNKFGNDNDEIDEFAREMAYTYTRPLEQYKNPRGGIFQAGL